MLMFVIDDSFPNWLSWLSTNCILLKKLIGFNHMAFLLMKNTDTISAIEEAIAAPTKDK